MQELLNQVLSELRSALRFRWFGMLLAWLACLGGWAYVAWMPDVYEGSARVYVDTSSALDPILGNQIVNQNVDDEIFYVREALTGQDLLERVIEEVGLGGEDQTELSAQQVARREGMYAALRNRIVIESSGAVGRGSPDSVYSISFRHGDREKAVGVVSTLLDAFVAETASRNRTGGETAERFLDERVAEYEERLQRAEHALAEFKKENADRLPGAEGGYFQRMQSERQLLDQAERDLRVLESKRQRLSEQLNSEAPMTSADTEAATQNLPPNSLDARIRDYQAQLDSLLLQYTERHPDVIAVRQTLEQLTAQREERLAALGLEGSERELASLGTNPVYQAVQIALNETEVEIATLRAEIADRRATVEQLQSLIDDVPEVEAELARLNRDYDVVYDQYVELVRRRETQGLTQKASDTDQVDFRIIDPPFAPLEPVAPNRPLMFSAVLAGALAAAGALCYVLAQLWPVFGGTRALRSVTELPVLGAVSFAWNDRRLAQKRRAALGYSVVLAALLVLFGGVITLEVLNGNFSLLGS